MTIKRLLLVAVCALIPACASTGQNAAINQQPSTTVEVDNQAVLDMTIYAYRGSERIRLGIANGLSRTTLTIPKNLVFGVTTLRFVADPIGGRHSPVSEEINVVAGDQIGLRIPAS
ncbi:MAG: hypothetical protein ABIS03_14715 [Gemmatimonadaceae bacterium]